MAARPAAARHELFRVVARDAEAVEAGRARRDRARFSRACRRNFACGGCERADGARTARALPWHADRGARQARAKLSAAGPLRLSRLAGRSALSLVRAARSA